MSSDHPDALNQRKWPGKNELGEALMDVRARLKEDMYNQQTEAAEAPEAAAAASAEGDSMDVDEEDDEDEEEEGDTRLYRAT